MIGTGICMKKISKWRNEKFSGCMNSCNCKNCGELRCSSHVGCLQLHHFYIIVATASILVHAALRAFIRLRATQLRRIETVHAIMKGNNKSCAYRKVKQEQTGCQDFFHDHKDKAGKQEIKAGAC